MTASKAAGRTRPARSRAKMAAPPAPPAAPDSGETDAWDQSFDDDFGGEWEQLPEFDCPPLESIPPAGLDIIQRRLGVDIHDDSTTLMTKVAATEWFFRNRAGLRCTFRQVMRGGTLLQQQALKTKEAKANPTKRAAASG